MSTAGPLRSHLALVVFAIWCIFGLETCIFACPLELADVVEQLIFLFLRDIVLLAQALPAPESKRRRRGDISGTGKGNMVIIRNDVSEKASAKTEFIIVGLLFLGGEEFSAASALQNFISRGQ